VHEVSKLKHAFQSALHALLYSNVFIALCALGFALAHLLLLRFEGPYWPLLSLVFGGTLSGYLALRLEGSRRLGEGGHVDRLLWVVRHRRWAWTLLGLGGALALLGYAFVQADTRWALWPALVLMLAYGWPFLPIPPKYRLRRRRFWKIFLIAAVWAWVGVVLPLVEADGGPLDGLPPMHWAMVLPVLGRFLFVVAITLPFDIRDIELDRVLRVRTLPAWLGIRRSIRLSRVLLLASLVLGLPALFWPLSTPGDAVQAVLSLPQWDGPQGQAFGVLLLFQVLLLLFTAHLVGRSSPMATPVPTLQSAAGREGENAYLYLGWLDGTLLLHAPAVWLGLYGAGLL
jgi:4-hydroxybenzoate polyprenyltransferase